MRYEGDNSIDISDDAMIVRYFIATQRYVGPGRWALTSNSSRPLLISVNHMYLKPRTTGVLFQGVIDVDMDANWCLYPNQ